MLMDNMSLFGDDIMKNYYEVTPSVLNGKIYGGTTAKFGITVNGKDYIVKMPKDAGLSVYTEYIASNFIQQIGYNGHTVFLGKSKNYEGNPEGFGDIEDVNIMLDFTEDKYELHSYKDTKQSSEDTDIGDKQYTYNDVIYMIDQHSKLDDENKALCIKQFWEMYVCDAILGNRDRHWGNWGYLIKDKRYYPAPLYDNGGSLYPGIFKVIHEFPSLKFMSDRTYIFPASLLLVEKGDRAYRTNYYDILSNTQNVDLLNVIADLKSRFSWKDIATIAFNIIKPLDIEPKLKEFWSEIIPIRYRCLIELEPIEPVYDEVRCYYAELCKNTI